MEESEDKKLFTQKGISIATFLGGPLAAGYLIRQNFRALGKEPEALVSIILGILLTAATFIPLFLLPEEVIDKIPNQLIPAIYTLIIYGIVEVIQGKDLKRHQEEQRQFESNWKATGIGLVWMLVLVGVLAVYVFTSPEMSGELDAEIHQKMEQIAVNEDKALKIYRMDPNTTSREDLIKVVEDEGIFYWNTNLQLLQEVQQYELEESYARYIGKLIEYTQVRQATYVLIKKSIDEETNKYNTEIERKNKAVEVLLQEIDQMSL